MGFERTIPYAHPTAGRTKRLSLRRVLALPSSRKEELSMRPDDVDRLRQAYPREGRPERRLAEALGVRLPAVAELHDEIASDLDEHLYGIGWWAPHPGTSRRILISDHLIQCAASIPRNMVEARLHLLEVLDYWERESDFVA